MQEITRLTKDLIRFKTMHANREAMHDCMGYLGGFLDRFGIPYQLAVHEDFPTLLVMPESHRVPILFISHIDVVDAPAALFDPIERDGKLYGRGSIDDKYAVALSMILLKEVLGNRRSKGDAEKNWPFGLLITSDEEIGGASGTGRWLKDIHTEFAIVLDGGGIDEIVVREKGCIRAKLVARGKTAHGARPWLGENAIEKLFADYQAIKRIFAPTREDHWHRTLNFSIIQAGKSINQVPEEAEALFDIRYTENDTVDELIAEMRGVIQGELVVEKVEPLFWGGDSPYLDLLFKIAVHARTGFSHGASDARFLSRHDIDGVVWGADGDLSQHAEDEHVNLHSVTQLYQYLYTFIERAPEIAP